MRGKGWEGNERERGEKGTRRAETKRRKGKLRLRRQMDFEFCFRTGYRLSAPLAYIATSKFGTMSKET